MFVAAFKIFISRFFETNCQFQCLKVEKEYKDRRESADKVNLSEAIYIHKGYKTKYVYNKAHVLKQAKNNKKLWWLSYHTKYKVCVSKIYWDGIFADVNG